MASKRSLGLLAKAMGVPADEMLQRARGVVPRKVAAADAVMTIETAALAIAWLTQQPTDVADRVMRSVSDEAARLFLAPLARRLDPGSIQVVRKLKSAAPAASEAPPASRNLSPA